MTATVDGIEALAQSDLARRQANTVRIGTVLEVDPAGNRVRVKSGGIETDWIKWTVRRAHGTRSWSAPAVGEQVVMASPSGDLRQAVVIGALPQDSQPPAGDTGDIDRTVYPDGTVVEYDHAAHQLQVILGPTTITADRTQLVLSSNGSSITIDASGIKLVGARIDLN